jgi:acetyl-CoA carboxylase biotin carboxyl carrier protein
MFDDTIAERVRPLAAAFSESGLARLSVREGEFEVEFRRAPQTAPAALAGDGVIEGTATERAADGILSELVGILRFLRPAVTEGQTVDGDVDLAFVETLGIRNAVRSRGAGRVVAVYVSDGQPVEYGQPLFAIER